MRLSKKFDIEKIIKDIEIKKSVEPIILTGKDFGKFLSQQKKASGGKK